MRRSAHRLILGLVALAATIGIFAPFATAEDHPIAVRVQNRAVPAGGSYHQPMNRSSNTIPLYSFDKSTYTVENSSDSPVTIHAIEVEPLEDGQPEEWHLRDASTLQQPPLKVDEQVIPAGETWEFILQFNPVRGNERSARVTIRYGDGGTYSFTAQGKGRPKDTEFFKKADLVWDRCLGANKTDEMTTGMAADESGNIYFSGNVAQVVHKFNHDVYVGRVNADGSLAWLNAWAGKHQDYQRDPGQNAESGGSAEAIAYDDGHVYLAISHSPTKSNSTFFSVIVKIAADTGKVVWQKAWGPTGGVKIARDSSEAYGLDVQGDYVHVTGVCNGNARVLFLALNKETGEPVHQAAIEVAPKINDRGYTVRADGKGGAYLGGLTNARGLLLHLSGIGSEELTISWAKKLSMGIGSNVNSLDVDANGNAYLSLDRRGARTSFSAMRVNSDGKVAWAKTYGKEKGDNNNTHVVRVHENRVYVGGRASIPWYDTQFGDGLLVRLDAENGELDWAAFYYGGKGAEEMAEHRLKGMAFTPDGHLLLCGQVYTNPNNHEHFWGHWYVAKQKLKDYKRYSETDLTETAALEALEGYGVRDAGALPSFHGYVDLTGDKPLEEGNGVMSFQTLKENEGNGPDGDTFIMKLKLKK